MKRAGLSALGLVLVACGPRARPAVTVMELDAGWRFHGAVDTTWIEDKADLPARLHRGRPGDAAHR